VQDKRVHDRKNLALPLRVVVGERTIEARTMDISVGGVRASIGEDLPFGTKVKVVVSLPTLDEASTIDAEVRWVQKGAEGGFAIGLQFLCVRARETWALNQLLRQP
jgi:hypothetical protein